MARGDVLEIVVFCLLFGLACHAVGARARPVVAFAEAVAAIAFKYTSFVMYLAPFAVCAAMAATVAEGGGESLAALAKFVALAWVAQIIYMVFVLGGSLLLARMPLAGFIEHARKPFLVAFATTSSAAALPQTLECLQALGVPKRVVGIVAPLSITFNMSGRFDSSGNVRAICGTGGGHESAAVGTGADFVDFEINQQGRGGNSTGEFRNFDRAYLRCSHLPLAVLPTLLGVDAVIDMIRTSVNVLGHCVAPPVIARWEGEDALLKS